VYKIGVRIFPDAPFVHAAGLSFTAAGQLFVGLSHQYFVEPMQAVAVAWSLYLCARAKEWPPARLGIHLAAVLVLGALAKATTPMYFLLPVAYVATQLFRGLRAGSLTGWWRERDSVALAAFVAVGGCLGGLWYLRHLGDVWRHVHDSSIGDIALEYGHQDTLFRKLAIWASLLSDAFLTPYLSWAIAAALILVVVRVAFRAEGAKQRTAPSNPLVVISLLQIVILLVSFSSTITIDSRYMYALLPFVATVFMQVCASVPRGAQIALLIIIMAQWTAVHAAAFSPRFPLSLSQQFRPMEPDRALYEEVSKVVRLVSGGPEHYNFVAVEEPWLNANSLDFFGAKEQLDGGARTYFASPGYAQKDTDAAIRRIEEFHSRYLITLRQDFQSRTPNFLNVTALPLLLRIGSDSKFAELPFKNRYGLVIFSVNSSSANLAALVESTTPPPVIQQANVVPGGSAALDSINGVLPSQDGSFSVRRTGVTSCDGWGFDDESKSTPAEVWLELKNSESGALHYWHAQRYPRPALASAVKIPSVATAGFRCDTVEYRLTPGNYAAHLYQLDGRAGKVSTLSTYTIPPRVYVP
jgi:multisubunit Na+/H+ antiporter MnhF subunit